MCWCVQTHLSFGREFTEAVEMKQVAQQEAERARFLVEKVRTHTHALLSFMHSVIQHSVTRLPPNYLHPSNLDPSGQRFSEVSHFRG